MPFLSKVQPLAFANLQKSVLALDGSETSDTIIIIIAGLRRGCCDAALAVSKYTVYTNTIFGNSFLFTTVT